MDYKQELGGSSEKLLQTTRPLSIAVVAPPWFSIPPAGYGGTEWICYWLVEGLVARGHKVTLIAAGENTTGARFMATYSEPPSMRLGELLPEVLHMSKAERHIARGRFDIVHDHTLIGGLLGRGRTLPTVLTAHGPVSGEVGEYYALLGGEIDLVAISDSQRKQSPDLPWIATVHNAIPVDDYVFSAEKEDFALFLGRMNPDKGVHLAIDAAREAGTHLVIAAKCNELAERRYFAEEIEPRLGPGVDYIGEAATPMKRDLLSRAKCLILPLKWEEPFGIVMAEALASGTPVVALRRGSVPEIVKHGETGFICDAEEDLPEALNDVTRLDPSSCRSDAKARFDVPIMVERYESVFDEIVRTSKEATTPEVGDLLEVRSTLQTLTTPP